MSENIQSTQRRKAVIAHQDGRHSEALELYNAHLNMYPDDAGMWTNFGVLLRSLGRHKAALRVQTRAFELLPSDRGIQTNYANILSDLGSYDASIDLRREILAKDPANLDHLAMIGRCLRGLGEYRAAVIHLRKALVSHPDDAELTLQLAFAQLGARDYSEGFDNYRARWRTSESILLPMPYPEWSGEPIAGKILTVLPEQGFGDAVFFMRFLPSLKKLGATVRVCVAKPVSPLFEMLQGADCVVPVSEAAHVGDFWINMIDVARFHFQSSNEIPTPTELTIPTASVKRAKKITAPHAGKFKVGIVWAGSTTYKGNAFRSFHHDLFSELLEEDGIQLFSLYKGPDLKAFERDGISAHIVNAAHDDRHFGDCAAMMRQMNLVITTDTATAHISGSLGCDTWVMLHWDPFWVWGHHEEKTPWYPNAKLFRQTIPLDWHGVMTKVKQALKEVAKVPHDRDNDPGVTR